jgi:hypothetical protein
MAMLRARLRVGANVVVAADDVSSMTSNVRVERRAASLTWNVGTFLIASTPLLPHRSCWPRVLLQRVVRSRLLP